MGETGRGNPRPRRGHNTSRPATKPSSGEDSPTIRNICGQDHNPDRHKRHHAMRSDTDCVPAVSTMSLLCRLCRLCPGWVPDLPGSATHFSPLPSSSVPGSPPLPRNENPRSQAPIVAVGETNNTRHYSFYNTFNSNQTFQPPVVMVLSLLGSYTMNIL